MTTHARNDDLVRRFAEQIEASLLAAIVGPVQKKPPTALRVRGNGFEVVELDAAGNVIEPPPRCCCYGVIHAPNCKYWLIST